MTKIKNPYIAVDVNWPIEANDYEYMFINQINDPDFRFLRTLDLYCKVSRWIVDSINKPWLNAAWSNWSNISGTEIVVAFTKPEDAILFRFMFPEFKRINNGVRY